MYCPNCGNSVPNDLKYCNGCGKRLGADEDKGGTPAKMLNKILITLFMMVWFGMGILIGVLAILLENHVGTDAVIAIAVLYIGAIFGICFTLARQIPKLIDARLRASENPAPYVPAPQLQQRTTAQLDEYREPVMSVTDHTTRVLEKVPFKEN